ncbi:hypothetical protein ACQPZX_17045 [Actinoplanes sp. CA-142083]|uniref:hypothetical protein n=1 Tax=Actinoplanes sp. CA-142083 TaxID=3239903 RepID=UPI003D8AD9ED
MTRARIAPLALIAALGLPFTSACETEVPLAAVAAPGTQPQADPLTGVVQLTSRRPASPVG